MLKRYKNFIFYSIDNMKTFTYIAHKLFIHDVKYEHDISIDTYKTIGTHLDDSIRTRLDDSIRRISYMEHIFNINQENLHANLLKCLFVLSNKPKFKELEQNIMDTFLISSENQNLFLDFFCNIQKIYWSFANFAKIIRQRYSKNKVDHDLLLAPISITQRNVIQLYDNNCTYLFTLQDLSHIIIAAVCNSPMFHSEPLNPKNPYSGVVFSTSNLYNIYFYMKERFSIVPDIVQKLFLSEFNLDVFGDNYKLIIRDTYLNQFVDNEDEDEIVDNIYDMINEFYPRINIDEDFPNDILINTFKIAVSNYIHYKYNFDLSKQAPNYKRMSTEINNILKKCPGIGRKIVVINNRKRYTSFITPDGRTEPELYMKLDTTSTIIDDDTTDSEPITDISNNLLLDFNEEFANRLNELIRQTDVSVDNFCDTENYDSDDEIEFNEDMYDP